MVRDMEPLLTSTFGGALAVLLGLLWGSFANVCIYRWPPTDEHPKGRSVVKPGSHCGSCKAPIAWYDNVPILSYLWLRGHCRNCKASFSPRYLLVEAVTAALFGVAWWFTLGEGGFYYMTFEHALVKFLIDAAFIFVLVVIAFIDLDHMLILDKVTFPSIAIAYIASLYDHHWWEGLIGAAIGYGLPWLIGWVYLKLRDREGLGLGDGKLLALVGALLGWKGVIVSLFGGALIGSIIGIVALTRAKSKDVMTSELPFGPFLSAAAVFYLFAEPWIVVYFRLL
ncbi:MAG TPA: prepilin peptidase [Kofleriaceae bacterium]|nr:prepilin peptidase [Kofleriaceae bacterium]